MQATQILDAIRGHNGQMMRVEIRSTVPTLKSVEGVTVTKQTRCYVTSGTEFANRKDIREAIEAGERGEVQALPWGEWSLYPFVISHKGNDYIRLYPPTEAQLAHFNLAPSVQWFANGSPIDADTAIVYCGSKAKPSAEPASVFAVNAANIVSIG
jgi:hypothetical protein